MSSATDSWRPVHRPPTYQLVVDSVEEQIVSGALAVGDRLPPERELTGLLGVSRGAIREGLRMLEAQGVLRMGTGTGPDAGTIVTATPSRALTRLLRLHVALGSFEHDDVVEARVMLERWSVGLAARNADETAHRHLATLLDDMDDETLSPEAFNDLDTGFHVALAEAGDNRLVADMTTAIRGAIRHRILAAFTTTADWPDLRSRLTVEHRAILAAVSGRDPGTAADAVESHIRGFFATLATSG